MPHNFTAKSADGQGCGARGIQLSVQTAYHHRGRNCALESREGPEGHHVAVVCKDDLMAACTAGGQLAASPAETELPKPALPTSSGHLRPTTQGWVGLQDQRQIRRAAGKGEQTQSKVSKLKFMQILWKGRRVQRPPRRADSTPSSDRCQHRLRPLGSIQHVQARCQQGGAVALLPAVQRPQRGGAHAPGPPQRRQRGVGGIC